MSRLLVSTGAKRRICREHRWYCWGGCVSHRQHCVTCYSTVISRGTVSFAALQRTVSQPLALCHGVVTHIHGNFTKQHTASNHTSRRTSGSYPRFILASDCVRPPVPTLWFLPHAGLHLELKSGMRYHPVSPPHHLWRLLKTFLFQRQLRQ